jgi:hypothetical protein
MTRILFFISLAFAFSIQLYGQEDTNLAIPKILIFNYDDSGNQIERKYESMIVSREQTGPELIAESYSDRIQVFPNPTSGFFYIEWKEEISQFIHSVEIISAAGLMSKFMINSTMNRLEIDLTSKQSGVYFIRFMFTDGSIVSKKVIKI